MKKTACMLLCILLSVCLFGCNDARGSYVVLPVEQTVDTVDVQMMDTFLTDNDDFSNYAAIRQNVPDILSYLVNITPDVLKEKCSIYRFHYPETSLSGETFLVYDKEVYHIGCAFGACGITEFAYTNDNGKDILYFIYCFGSGLHYSNIGAFNFETKQITDYTVFCHPPQDIAFCLSKDKKTLGICKAFILGMNWDVLEVKIIKGKRLYDDIHAFDFEALDAAES